MIVCGQNSGEKLAVDKAEYKSLLLTCNKTADKLALIAEEAKLQAEDIKDYKVENSALLYQIENQKKYIKHIKKQKRKAWFNGVWQGAAGGGGLVFLLLLI